MVVVVVAAAAAAAKMLCDRMDSYDLQKKSVRFGQQKVEDQKVLGG